MNVLIKSAEIFDLSSPHNGKKRDVLIENGIIRKIAISIPNPKKIKEVTLPNLKISQGWFDSSVSFGEPGYEERETIDNGLNTAASSGFTHVAVNANTQPVSDSKSNIQFLKAKAESHAVNLYPIGALTMKSEGVDLAELYDMKNEGAVSFYDYKLPIKNPNLLKLALQYSQNFDGLVQSFPMEKDLAPKGMVNEEVNSTLLGLKGIPALAEELQITRDLYILEYTGGKLHIPTISTKKSIALLKEAKKKGLQVTCSVSASHLCLTDENLNSFDTHYKLMPPLRTKKDIKALLKGIQDGIIDGVTSDHNPINIEDKKIEFDHAKYGSIGLESCYGALQTVLDTESSIKMLTGLKEAFDIPIHSINEGNQADLCLFSSEGTSSFSEADILSSSKNSAFLGHSLQGKVFGVYANKKLIVNK